MITDAERTELNKLTEKVIGCAYIVSNILGCGFLEKIYENAMAIELRKAGLKVEQQAPIKVLYGGVVVGEYFADLLIEGRVIVELKAVRGMDAAHEAQCLNYLKATALKVALLINFGEPKVKVKRFVR